MNLSRNTTAWSSFGEELTSYSDIQETDDNGRLILVGSPLHMRWLTFPRALFKGKLLETCALKISRKRRVNGAQDLGKCCLNEEGL